MVSPKLDTSKVPDVLIFVIIKSNFSMKKKNTLEVMFHY